MRDTGDEGRCAEKPDAGNFHQPLNNWILIGNRAKFSFNNLNTRLDFPDLRDEKSERTAQTTRYGCLGILENPPHGSDSTPRTARHQDPVLSQESAQRIDAGRTGRHPLVANAMERKQLLLHHGFHRYGLQTLTAHGIEQAGRVGAVRFLAPDKGPYVLRGRSVTRCPRACAVRPQ